MRIAGGGERGGRGEGRGERGGVVTEEGSYFDIGQWVSESVLKEVLWNAGLASTGAVYQLPLYTS